MYILHIHQNLNNTPLTIWGSDPTKGIQQCPVLKQGSFIIGSPESPSDSEICFTFQIVLVVSEPILVSTFYNYNYPHDSLQVICTK